VFCPNCGARNSEADSNCQKCGFNLKEQAGAKFKGTMLMMNNASAMAAELRRSAPPGAANPANPAGTPNPVGAPGSPAAADPNAPKQSLSPEAAKQMRAQLKGTMIGVAPPALGANKPPGGAAPAPQGGGMTVPRPASSRPPAPMGAGPLPRQPGPGQVNAPGPGITRGGGTIIGTGIAPTGSSPLPPAAAPIGTPAAPYAAPVSAGALTEAFPVSGGEPFGGPAQADLQGFDRTHVSPSAPPAPAFAQPAFQAQPPVQPPSPAAFPGTQVMSAFEPFPTQDPALSGTLVAGSAYTGPSTVSGGSNEARFAPNAGQRTDTPAMGIPSPAYSPTEPAPAGRTVPERTSPERTLPDRNSGFSNSSQPTQSRAMVITLTVLTCGLYWVYQKFMAKNG
jgi:hypothetical protein